MTTQISGKHMLCSASAFLEALLLRVPADMLRDPIVSEGKLQCSHVLVPMAAELMSRSMLESIAVSAQTRLLCVKMLLPCSG